MITIDNLSYRYRKGPEAVSCVSATIEPGIHLLLGENGAGKTTLLHLMAGLLFPTAGRVELNGADPARRDPETLRQLFFLAENMIFPAKTIREFAGMHSRLYPTFDAEAFNRNLSDFGLTGDENLARQSLGNRKKSNLSYVLALGVNMLLLDEPTNGLDITSRKTLRQMIARSMTDDSTIIIATHSVHELNTLYDGVIILNHSRLLVAMPSWQIAERLMFTDSPVPAEAPLYEEQEIGVFHSISPNRTSETSDVNYSLLYSALLSPARDYILNALNTLQ